MDHSALHAAPASRAMVGGIELIYEDFDAEPVTEERMQAKLRSLSNSGDEFRGRNVANCRRPQHEYFKRERERELA